MPPPYRVMVFKKVEYKAPSIYDMQIEKVKKKIDELKEHFDTKSEKDMFVGTAFVTFNDQNNVEKVIEHFSVSFPRQVINFIWYKLFCQKNNIDDRYIDGQQIHVERAAEPLDIFWENLSISTRSRLKRVLISYLITFLVLAVVFGVNLGLNFFKVFLENST